MDGFYCLDLFVSDDDDEIGSEWLCEFMSGMKTIFVI